LAVEARVNHLIGVGYSKDLYLNNSVYDNSNQLNIAYDVLFDKLSCGLSFRYYNMFQNDDRRLIFAQGLANIGYIIHVSNFNAMLSVQYGFWEREKSLSAYENDAISNELLHEETESSNNVGNGYDAFGPRLKIWYNFQIFKRFAIAPMLAVEILRNHLLYSHNPILLQGKQKYEVYISGGICVKI